MMGIVWSEASRSEEVAKRLEQTGRRRKRKPKKSKAAAMPKAAPKYHVDKHSCFAIQSSLNPRRLVVVNWNKHPVLDIKVVEDGGIAFPEDPTTPEANSGVSVKSFSNRPVCDSVTCYSLAEATQIFQDRLLRKIDPEKLVLVGHGVERLLYEWNIRSVGWKQQRCTATYPPYMEEESDQLLLPAELDDLMQRILKRRPSKNLWHQAAAALDLYRKAQQFWERDLEEIIEQRRLAKPVEFPDTPELSLEDILGASSDVRSRADTVTTVASIEMEAGGRSRADTATSTVSSLMFPLGGHDDNTKSESIWGTKTSKSPFQRWPFQTTRAAPVTVATTVSSDVQSVSEFSQEDMMFPPIPPQPASEFLDQGLDWLDGTPHGSSSPDPHQEADNVPLLPSKLLSESFSESENEGTKPREEANHPIFHEDWLSSPAASKSPKESSRGWFSWKTAAADFEPDLPERPGTPTSSFSLFRRRGSTPSRGNTPSKKRNSTPARKRGSTPAREGDSETAGFSLFGRRRESLSRE